MNTYVHIKYFKEHDYIIYKKNYSSKNYIYSVGIGNSVHL